MRKKKRVTPSSSHSLFIQFFSSYFLLHNQAPILINHRLYLRGQVEGPFLYSSIYRYYRIRLFELCWLIKRYFAWQNILFWLQQLSTVSMHLHNYCLSLFFSSQSFVSFYFYFFKLYLPLNEPIYHTCLHMKMFLIWWNSMLNKHYFNNNAISLIKHSKWYYSLE